MAPAYPCWGGSIKQMIGLRIVHFTKGTNIVRKVGRYDEDHQEMFLYGKTAFGNAVAAQNTTYFQRLQAPYCFQFRS